MAAAWIVGLFSGAQWASPSAPILAAVAVILGLALARVGDELHARLWVVPLSLLALLCGLAVAPSAASPCTTVGAVSGTAIADSVRHGSTEARVRLRLVDTTLLDTGLRISEGQRVDARLPSRFAPPSGSTIWFQAELRPRTELRNPSPHPRLTPPRMACWARFDDTPELRVVRASAVQRWVAPLRARVRGHLTAALPEHAAAVARALVLGDGSALGYERRRTVAAVGLAHLFAVSGLHIALVSGTLVSLLRWLLRGLTASFDPRRLASAIGVPLTLFHASFAGGSPSAWRAAITAALTWGLVAIARRPSAPAITGAAALLLSVPDPSMALRPAFLLSIVATSAILSGPRLSGRWRRLRTAASISFRTLVATTPMVWWWFGGVPLVGWLSNIVVLPFGSFVVIPLAHAFALTAWLPRLAPYLAPPLSAAVELLLEACSALRPLAVTNHLPPLTPAQGLVVLGGCGLILALRSWRARLAVLAVSSALWLGAEAALIAREHPTGRLRVTFVDVGQGDAALVDFPDGRLAVVDTGHAAPHPAGRALLELLAARRRARIDLLAITHGHPDHGGGLAALLDSIEVGEIWLNGQRLVEEQDGSAERLVNQALRLGATVRFASDLCANTHEFAGAQIEVLWPCPSYDPGLGLNDNSLVLRLSYGRHAFLLTGDIEAEAERRLVDLGRVRPADVLKVAHHGSRTSSTSPFLRAASPSVAVISSGAGNRYGHPSGEVVDRLRAAGARVHRTDRSGGLIVSTDGESLELGR